VSYPDLEAGIFLSRKLVFSLHERLTKGEAAASHSFNIDPSYEFAKFLRTGCGLTTLNFICNSNSLLIKK
jgi:hypothetical protein